jgi:hypothetical protein
MKCHAAEGDVLQQQSSISIGAPDAAGSAGEPNGDTQATSRCISLGSAVVSWSDCNPGWSRRNSLRELDWLASSIPASGVKSLSSGSRSAPTAREKPPAASACLSRGPDSAAVRQNRAMIPRTA